MVRWEDDLGVMMKEREVRKKREVKTHHACGPAVCLLFHLQQGNRSLQKANERTDY